MREKLENRLLTISLKEESNFIIRNMDLELMSSMYCTHRELVVIWKTIVAIN